MKRQIWLFLGITRTARYTTITLARCLRHLFTAVALDRGRRFPRRLRISGNKYGSCVKGLSSLVVNSLNLTLNLVGSYCWRTTNEGYIFEDTETRMQVRNQQKYDWFKLATGRLLIEIGSLCSADSFHWKYWPTPSSSNVNGRLLDSRAFIS